MLQFFLGVLGGAIGGLFVSYFYGKAALADARRTIASAHDTYLRASSLIIDFYKGANKATEAATADVKTVAADVKKAL